MSIVKGDKTGEWWYTDLYTKKLWIPSAPAAAQIVFCAGAAGQKVGHNGNLGPIVVEQALIDKVPDVATHPG
jgi:hypothetical protein